MVQNYWYVVARSLDIGKSPVGLRRFGRDLVLWRDGAGQLHCFDDRCPHRGAPLSGGRLLDNGCLQCPYHGLQFDAAGRCVLIPAAGTSDRVPPAFDLAPHRVEEQDGFVWLWWGDGQPRSPIPHFGEVPPPSTPTYTITLDWDVPFSRTMESMFDMHHFPFLHRKVSRGLGTLLDPYHATMNGDRIETWGNLRPGDGRSVEVAPGFAFRVSVIFPAMMYMGLTDKLRLLVVAAPVDEGRTWLALRYYQTYVQLPWLGTFIARLSAELERIFVHPDDERQLKALRPPLPGGVENRFIGADQGTILWLRRYRRELAMQAAGVDARPNVLDVAVAPVE